jgi:hypothetical protein
MKKKSDKPYSMHHAAGGLNKAQIQVYLETQEDEKSVYQNFRLVTSEFRLLTYFTNEAFLGYHILDQEMAKYYAGDGEKIIFRMKMYFNNLITVVFDKLEKDAKVRKEIVNAQFRVEAPIPATQGCLDCEHFRKNNRVCQYYQIIGIKIRMNCPDFRQKEVQHGKRKKESPKDNSSDR